MPSADNCGIKISRKQRCCSSAKSWTCFETAVKVSPGVNPSGPTLRAPSRISRLRRATRTMKNSSRLELKMAEKLHPLEQWNGFVLRFLEQAPIELKPGELTIDVCA